MAEYAVGDRIRLGAAGRVVEATVVLASPNSRSLVVSWDDGMLLGYLGSMALFEEGGQYRDLLTGSPVEVSVS